MGYLGLGFMRIELKAPVTISAYRVNGLAEVTLWLTVTFLAVVKQPSPVTAFASAACNRPMEPSKAIRLLELRVRLPNKIPFNVSERLQPLTVLVCYVVWAWPANRIFMPAPCIRKDNPLPPRVEKYPN